MFIGQYIHSLDDKNRLTIPSKFRGKLGEKAIMTIGFDNCIAIYTQEEWNNLQAKLLALNSNQSDTRKYIRFLIGSASECECDSNGRVIIPTNLLQFAGIKKETIVLGSLNHIEIWASEQWQRYYDDASKHFNEVAEKLEF